MRFLSLFVFLFSCSSKIGKLSDVGAPDWVFSPYSISDKDEKDNYVAGVGMACKTETGLKVQILKAEADGRLSIAKQVGVNVNSSLDDFVSENERAGDQKLDYVKKFQSSSQEIIDQMPVMDAVRTNIWQNPKDDCIFIRLVAPKEPIKKYLIDKLNISLDALKDKTYKKNVEVAVSNSLNNNDSPSSQQKPEAH